jgi:hypothetical protein
LSPFLRSEDSLAEYTDPVEANFNTTIAER